MIDILFALFGVLGITFGVRCYWELHKWADQCKNARIAIAYKQRVQIQAPLVEWLQWANQLAKDEASRGRVVYRNQKVSVAILRPASKHDKQPTQDKGAKRPPERMAVGNASNTSNTN